MELLKLSWLLSRTSDAQWKETFDIVVIVLLCFFLTWTSEEIVLSNYIDCESAFLAGRALLSPYLYELAGENTGNFSTVYCHMFVSLASSSQVLPKPSLLCSSVLFEGGWQSKEMFYVKQSPSTLCHKPPEMSQAGLLATD